MQESSNLENFESPISSQTFQLTTDEQAMALLALNHTKLEHQLYEIMYGETKDLKSKTGEFSVHYLMKQANVYSYNRIQRARHGLMRKMSIESHTIVKDSLQQVVYKIYSPAEILERRRCDEFISQSPNEWSENLEDSHLWSVIERIIEKKTLSRREAQVALRCAEGLTNAQIGEKLFIHEETVKFHLHNIFMKFGIKRRTELVAHLYRH